MRRERRKRLEASSDRLISVQAWWFLGPGEHRYIVVLL